MATSKIFKVGGKMMSSYAPNGNEMKNLIHDYYDTAVAKSAGWVGYNSGPNEAYFNAIMGKQITAGMFASNNILAGIGARPYDHEGVRVAYKLAKKGGIGATTPQDGPIPDSVGMPIKEIREPYKDLPFAFDYGLGLMELEDKDDTIERDQYIDMMTANYSDGLDTDLLRKTSSAQPTASAMADMVVQPRVATVETCITPLSHIIASYKEIGKTYAGESTQVSADMVTPYGGQSASDLKDFRKADATDSNFNCFVINDVGGTTEAPETKTLSSDDFNKAYDNTALYWADYANPNNKMWGMSLVALEKLGADANNKNRWLDSVFVQKDFNGVKTMPGRELGGVLASAYRNIPIIVDGNYNYDATTEAVGSAVGEVHLIDLDHIWMSMLTPVEFRSTQDFAITRKLREQNVMTCRMETRVDKFIGHAKITNRV